MRTRNIFWALVAVYLLHAIVRFFTTPSSVLATHFGLDGSANGWMSSGAFGLFHYVVVAFVLGMRWLLVATARRQKGINIPEYHRLSDAGKQTFAGFMENHSWIFGSLMIGFFMLLDIVIVLANTQSFARTSMVIGLIFTVFFLGTVGWWTIALLSAIQRIKKQNL